MAEAGMSAAADGKGKAVSGNAVNPAIVLLSRVAGRIIMMARSPVSRLDREYGAESRRAAGGGSAEEHARRVQSEGRRGIRAVSVLVRKGVEHFLRPGVPRRGWREQFEYRSAARGRDVRRWAGRGKA